MSTPAVAPAPGNTPTTPGGRHPLPNPPASSTTGSGYSSGGGGGGSVPGPTKPRFGGLFGGTSSAVWIGGPPDENFTDTILNTFPTPLAIRGLSPESEIKGYSKRVLSGCTTKFKRDDPEFNLMAFADEALVHMQTTGMDSVFYMKGASTVDGTGARELFTYHSKFTKSHVSAFIKDKVDNGVFDSYAKTCLQESATWLVNSLDESLKASLCPQLASRPSGPEVWMMIVSEVQADSLRRCALLQKKFQALKLANFKGENVREYAAEADTILVQLDRDDQFFQTYLLDMVDQLSACSVMEFKIHWMTKRSRVEEFVKETLGKDKEAIELMPNKITFRDLLEDAKEKYNNLQHLWGPGANLQQDKAMVGQMRAFQSKLSKLDQAINQKTNGGGDGGSGGKPGGGKKPISCWDCNGPHMRKDCPGLKSKGDDSSGNPPPPQATGKWAAPKPGEPHEKEIDGVKKKWCSKCRKGRGKWNKDHFTKDHKTKEMWDAERAAAAAAGGAPRVSLAEATGNMMCQEILSTWDNK